MKAAGVAAAILLCACPAVLSASAHITIVNTDPAGQGLNDPTPRTPVGGNPGTTLGQQRLNALNYAASLWGALLDSPVEIRIRAGFASLQCDATTAVLAQTGPTQGLSDFVPNPGFPGPEFPATWYPVALANRRAGKDLLPGIDDIGTTINMKAGKSGCGFDFYYGLDGQAGPNIDLVTVLLHEFTHGLGFVTEVNLSTGEERLGQQPDVFERKIFDNSMGKLWIEMTDAERAASAVNSGKVVWVGSAVTAMVPGIMKGTPTLQVVSPASVAGKYAAQTADFGQALTDAGLLGQLVAAIDPSDAAGPSTFDACSALTNASAVAGKIALVDRSLKNCTFVVKTRNAQAAGAIGVVVADTEDATPPPGMTAGGQDTTDITIPAAMITKADGAKLRAALDSGVAVDLLLDDTRLAGTDGENHLLLYTPNPLSSGSSVVHWDTSDFPNLLMEPSINADLNHGVDVTLAFLRDIGWYPDPVARDPLTPLHGTRVPKKLVPRP